LGRPIRLGLVWRGTVFSFSRAFRHGGFRSYGALGFCRPLDIVRRSVVIRLCGVVVLPRVIWLGGVTWWRACFVRRRTRHSSRSRKAWQERIRIELRILVPIRSRCALLSSLFLVQGLGMRSLDHSLQALQ
jgi:hypothetical protein